ncbi:M1 family metallopeptidase [Arthrobacter sp. I2-34]|uniref:Aminopeptidase N n=1 Tax=Arthrobacter hankyongi TaxID=2904801 RepID=A0ABS9L0V8_9MICC|nr:M1 family metallopeptidase [Arthrobacter hankyongi]MCG2620306.1 M1 family metallopeptidase [Arthrobacter hankyongi]
MTATPPDSNPVPDRYLPTNGSADFAVTRYDLELECKLAANRLAGHALLSGHMVRGCGILELDLSGLQASRVQVNGQRPRRMVQRAGKLIITLRDPLPAGAALTIDVRYEGNPAPVNGLWGDVGWEELTDGVLVAAQPNGASSWFPCNDHPSQKASYRISVSTDAGYRAVANGALVAHTRRSSRETWVYEMNAPMATYLATLQIGRYGLHSLFPALTDGPAAPDPGSSGTGSSGTAEPVPQMVAVSGQLRHRAEAALASQQRMMEVFGRCFGLYPFGRYTVVVTEDELEIPLEAQSLSIIGRNHLEPGWENQRLIAHELAHQWFGNSLTLRQWRDIWLHEGFACYAEWIWSEASGAATAASRARIAWRKLSSQPQDIAIGDPGAARMFDDRVYQRGALTLHALRTAVGDTDFFRILRRWTAQHRHGSVETSMFLSLVDEESDIPRGLSARGLLEPWLYRTELPAFPGK